jgi:putative endonuclease
VVSRAGTRGAEAEDQAAALLQAAGLKLLARNARSRGGELDLVALDGEVLVVVEVRARAPNRFAGAAESVDARKQARIVQATQAWLLQNPAHARRAVRFDVLGFDGEGPPQWWRAAFTAEGT